MSRSLLGRLVLPLMALAVVLLIVNARWEAGGLFLNLATELIGIVITVAYIEWLLHRYDSERWRGAGTRVTDRLREFAGEMTMSIRIGLGFGTDVIDREALLSGDQERISREMRRLSESVLEPAVRERVSALDEAGWADLAGRLQSIWTQSDHILAGLGPRLEPAQLEAMLDIQSTAQGALRFWQSVPEYAVAPADRLRSPGPPAALQRAAYDSTTTEIRRLLAAGRRLLSP